MPLDFLFLYLNDSIILEHIRILKSLEILREQLEHSLL